MLNLEVPLETKIASKTAQVAIIGLGYVGLPFAIEVARTGFSVVGVDTDPARVASVNSGRSYIGDVNNEELAEFVKAERLISTTDYTILGGADIVIICVPTPLTKSKEPDLSYVIAAAKGCVPQLRRGQLVILESTTYPGTTVEIVCPILEERGLRAGNDFHLVFSPERIDPGNRRVAYGDIPKVIGGLTPACAQLAEQFYKQVVRRVVVVSSPTVAEMVKVYENVFRNVNIALVNELTLLCHRMNLNVWEIIEAAASKPYGFMPFSPGPGVGGHCIPVDPYYLAAKAREYDFHVRFIELAAAVNDSMPYHVVSTTTTALGAMGKTLRSAKVLVLGAAYKKDISDVRESPALKILELLEKNGASAAYHDPYVPKLTLANPRVTLTSLPLTEETLSEVDCVIVATDHSTVDYTWIVEQARLVIDTRNVFRDHDRQNVVKI